MDVVEEALEIIGLTKYESAAYIALNSLISDTAANISNAANIPRSRVMMCSDASKGKVSLKLRKVNP